MKAVTVLGVSRIFEDQLNTLMATFRNETGDQSWHIHMQRLPSSQYSVRLYAPDRHSQAHAVKRTPNTANDIWNILVKEAQAWELRMQQVLMVADDIPTDQRPNL
jgi:hypothetical protein